MKIHLHLIEIWILFRHEADVQPNPDKLDTDRQKEYMTRQNIRREAYLLIGIFFITYLFQYKNVMILRLNSID